MAKNLLRKMMIGGISGLAGSLVVWGLFNLGGVSEFFRRFEAVTYDWRLRKLITPPEKQIEDVVIVNVDGRSLQKLGAFYQWPRTLWGDALKVLQKGKVRLVGIDVLFDRSKRFIQEDKSFINTIKKSGNVFNALVLTPADPGNFLYGMPKEPAGLQVDRFRFQVPDELLFKLQPFDRFEPEFSKLLNAGSGIGSVNLSSDNDGILRRIPLFVRFNENAYPTLAMAMALNYLEVEEVVYHSERRELELKRKYDRSVNIPIDDQGRMLVHYYGPFRTFRYIPFYSLLYELKDQEKLSEFLKSKFVFIGTSAPGLFDLRATPRQPSFPGVEVHANVLHQIIQQDFISELSWQGKLGFLLLVGIIVGILYSFIRPLKGIVLSLIIGVLVFIATFVAFSLYSTWVPLAAPLLSILLTFSIHYTYRYQIEERHQRKIKDAFSHYVSAGVVNEILKSPDKIKLGGEKKLSTILFSDLAGFTELAETSHPENMVKILNEYFTEMTEIILKNDGTLDKFYGDAVMAIFGAPVNIGNHVKKACRTALMMQRKSEELREVWRRQKSPELYQRIGINTGEMIIGNMGSEIHFNYTAIGDAVNMGARLESANKLYGSSILISEDTYQFVKDHIIVRQLDLLLVKGKTEPIYVYELIAMKDEPLEVQVREKLHFFKVGYQHYLEQNWDWAANQFRQVLQIDGKDGPARLFLFRCQEYLKNPPGEKWSGVYTMTEK